MAASSVSLLADRYARALYELALQSSTAEAVAGELSALQVAITDSLDFARALQNPVLGRTGQANALGAIATKLGAGKLVTNFLRLVAQKGRQAALPQIIAAYHTLAAAARGELLAEVTSAAPLSDAQTQSLTRELSAKHSGKVTLQVTIDPSLLGGFRARIGTKLYDRTLSSQLSNLMLKLKEAA